MWNIQAARQAFKARLEKEFARREAARKKALQAVYAVAPTIMTGYPAIRSACVFGSILRPGSLQPGSDIDLAIEGGTAEDYFAIWHDLEDAMPDWRIDLRDLSVDTRFAEKVYLTGEKIYVGMLIYYNLILIG